MNKKLAAVLCAGLLTISLVGCSATEEKAPETSNETQTEQTQGFTGEKVVETAYGPGKTDVVVTTVKFENGNPTDVNIDVKMGDKMKSELAASGEYVMKEGGTPWNEQIDALEKFITENKFDLEKVTLTDADGHTDAVSGVSIKVPVYFEGINEAIAQASADYKGFTGSKVAEIKGEKDTTVAVVTFKDGKPVDVKIDAITEEGNKSKLSAEGKYEMKGAQAPWHEQVATFEKFVVENNFDLAKITLNDEGATDAISGVSIKVPAYVDAIKAALELVK